MLGVWRRSRPGGMGARTHFRAEYAPSTRPARQTEGMDRSSRARWSRYRFRSRWDLDAPPVRVGAPHRPIPYQKDLELQTIPGAAEIVAAVRTLR